MSIEERAALAEAIEDDNLISLRVLNSPFPDQRDRAILSYAESSSLVTFVIQEYGSAKLGELISVFAKGAHYDDAMMQVFGVDMDGMEDRWRAHIGAQPRTGTTRATPIPSATFTPEPTSPPTSEGINTLVPTPAATATTLAMAPTLTATPAPQETLAPTSTPMPASRGPCLGAAPALVMFALFIAFRPRSAR